MSALAMTGIKLTREPSLFITSTSKGDRLYRMELVSQSIYIVYQLYNLRVASWLDKVQADVDSHINNTLTTGLLFLSHIILVLIIKEINNGDPTMTIIHIITEPRGINNSQFDLEHFFLQFCFFWGIFFVY